MPKYSYMISKAVDLVARKLAGLDSETIARLNQVLSEEAQVISDELQNSGESVDSDILAARLEGLVARMKYEVRNQGPDPSPHEFPIFNVSHNPSAPYPNPINHLYDERYKEAYSTFIKQSQPPPSAPSNNEPSTPTSPASARPALNPNTAYHQGQYQQRQQAPHPPGFLPAFRQQPPRATGQYMNPYATMPRSQAAYYQQQAAKIPQPVQEKPSNNQPAPVRRSSTGEDIRSHSLSRSASSSDLTYSTNPAAEKIRVRVINDNPTSSATAVPYKQRSILKPNNGLNNIQETGKTRTIYAAPNTAMGAETMEDLFKVANNPQSATSSSPMTERVIIIDRRGPNASDHNNPIASGQDRFRTFEIRSSATGVTPTTATTATAATATATPTTNAPSSRYVAQQPNFYGGQQVYYQQPKMFVSTPNNLYSAVVPYGAGANNYYPFAFYHY